MKLVGQLETLAELAVRQAKAKAIQRELLSLRNAFRFAAEKKSLELAVPPFYGITVNQPEHLKAIVAMLREIERDRVAQLSRLGVMDEPSSDGGQRSKREVE